MKSKTILAGLVLSMALFAGNVLADEKTEDKAKDKGDRTALVLERMTEHLSLSEQQVIRVKAIMERRMQAATMNKNTRMPPFENELFLVLTPEQQGIIIKDKAARNERMKARGIKSEERKKAAEAEVEKK